MHRFPNCAGIFALLAPALFFFVLRADDVPSQLKERSITSAPGKVGDLLRQWWREGTAAGNGGDWYDNRDAGHSELDLTPYPQLRKIPYSAEDMKKKRHWGAQLELFVAPRVVFGNSSTSAPPTVGGSIPRWYYTQSAGIGFLYKQYTGNNLYIYPEHRDHDPGHNGPDEGFGDLYPTNTPYLLISQGSSGSDQSFLRAVAFTLAAFRPEVKRKLIDTGLLMPTVQMLLRSTNRHLQEPGAYLSGLAHPTVFEGSWLNELGLVQAAHAMEVDKLPPMVQLQVLEEDEAVPGRDFFDRAGSEKLADTPAAIARIFRGKDYRRHLVVSAERSFDVSNKPLSYTWIVLRGDKDKIKITPRNENQSIAEIVVPYHGRGPIAAGSTMASNRVDIGVFVNNGTSYSAPGFITLYSLDNEARSYDDQERIVEIGYGMGETHVSVANWPAFFKAMTREPPDAKYFPVSTEMRDLFVAALPKFSELQKKGTPKEMQDFLSQVRPTGSIRAVAEARVRRAVEDIDLVPRFWSETSKTQYPFPAILKELSRMGLLSNGQTGPPKVKLLGNRPTIYEKFLIERANTKLLTQWLLPGTLAMSTATNFVDQRLATPKDWRDIYHYDEQGNPLGWTRHGEDKALDFTADGLLVVAKDELGRCRQARAVAYVQRARTTPGLNDNPLRMVILDELVTYEYAGNNDRKGKIVAREKVPHTK